MVKYPTGVKMRNYTNHHSHSNKSVKFPIHITIPGEAVPMYRPRVNRRTADVYNPPVMVNYERYARLQGIHQYHGKPLSGKPLFVKIFVFIKMHKNWSKRKKRAMENRFVIKRPDLDNYGKDIVDAFNGVLYKDDNLMAQEYMAKMYSIHPRVEFYVEPINETKVIK